MSQFENGRFCSAFEVEYRVKNQLIHRLELKDPSQFKIYQKNKRDFRLASSLVSVNHCLKEFRRSAAGQDHHKQKHLTLLTVDQMLNASRYLLTEVFNQVRKLSADHPRNIFGFYYLFAFDRIRAIRQDLTIQQFNDWKIVEVLENCVEFYLYSHYIARTLPENSEDFELMKDKFDVHLNTIQLKETLSTLFTYYKIFEQDQISERRAEFEIVGFLTNIEGTKLNLHGHLSSYLDRDIVRHAIEENIIKVIVHVRRYYDRAPLLVLTFHTQLMDQWHSQIVEIIAKSYRARNQTLSLAEFVPWFLPSLSTPHDLTWAVQYLTTIFQNAGIPVQDGRALIFDRQQPAQESRKFVKLSHQWIGLLGNEFDYFLNCNAQ